MVEVSLKIPLSAPTERLLHAHVSPRSVWDMKTITASNVTHGGRRNATAPALGPQWVGVPAKGHCPYSGLSRPHIYNLVNDGIVRSACLRQPGAIRGRRLIYLPSLLAYLDKCADEETARLAKLHEGERGAA